MPLHLHLLGMLLLIRIFSSFGESGKRLLSRAEILAFTLNCVGQFYLYPEATLFFLPAYVMVILFSLWKLKPKIPILVSGLIFAFGWLLLSLVKENNLEFAVKQFQFAIGSDVAWWKYFQAFLGATVFSFWHVD